MYITIDSMYHCVQVILKTDNIFISLDIDINTLETHFKITLFQNYCPNYVKFGSFHFGSFLINLALFDVFTVQFYSL